MNKIIINRLLTLCKKSYKKKEVPVAAIIVHNNKIISTAYNTKEKTHNPLNHAEIIAIKKAAKKLKAWNLNECILYTSLEPCEMCKSVINEAKIKTVYYVCKSKYSCLRKANMVKVSYKEKEITELLQTFFKEIRK